MRKGVAVYIQWLNKQFNFSLLNLMKCNSYTGYVIPTDWLLETAVDIEQGVTTIDKASMCIPVENKRHKLMTKYTSSV